MVDNDNFTKYIMYSVGCLWIFVGTGTYFDAIADDQTYETAITTAIIAFPAYVTICILGAIGICAPAYMWLNIWEKIGNGESFDCFEWMFLFSNIFDDE